jgi:hypothetical protein
MIFATLPSMNSRLSAGSNNYFVGAPMIQAAAQGATKPGPPPQVLGGERDPAPGPYVILFPLNYQQSNSFEIEEHSYSAVGFSLSSLLC